MGDIDGTADEILPMEVTTWDLLAFPAANLRMEEVDDHIDSWADNWRKLTLDVSGLQIGCNNEEAADGPVGNGILPDQPLLSALSAFCQT